MTAKSHISEESNEDVNSESSDISTELHYVHNEEVCLDFFLFILYFVVFFNLNKKWKNFHLFKIFVSTILFTKKNLCSINTFHYTFYNKFKQ